MIKALMMTLTAVGLSLLCFGCMGRLISEGMGSARGASGKVVDMGVARDLTKYKSLRVESISVSPGLQTPADMLAMVGTDLAAAAEESGLKPEGEPGLKLSGEIIHYETGGTIDTAIGPLEEVVVRTKLIDVQSGTIVAEANLIGRSKATSSSGAKNLSAGVGEALDKWLKDRGLKKAGEEQED